MYTSKQRRKNIQIFSLSFGHPETRKHMDLDFQDSKLGFEVKDIQKEDIFEQDQGQQKSLDSVIILKSPRLDDRHITGRGSLEPVKGPEVFRDLLSKGRANRHKQVFDVFKKYKVERQKSLRLDCFETDLTLRDSS